MNDRIKGTPNRLYKDRENRMLCGVCAGVADYFGFDLTATRVLTVVLQFMFPATFLVYIVMCMLLPKKPRELYEDQEEEQFWSSVRKSPMATVASVRHKMREIDAKLQRMERYVTSPGFTLDQEFRELED
ncbi:MAG: envelope stress response membrane protein PspC [Gammaproteobacteria bacterium]|jgi:phage shock protein C